MTEQRDAMEVSAATVLLEHESDDSGLKRLLAEGQVHPDEICAVTGKTEGHGDDETSRAAAIASVKNFLADHSAKSAAEIDQIPMVFSCGGVGILAPNLVVYSRRKVPSVDTTTPSLVIGGSQTQAIRPEWIGRRPMIDAVAAGVRVAAADAGIDPEDAVYVMTKSRARYSEDVEEAGRRGVALDLYEGNLATTKTSGCAALGVRLALEGLTPPPDELVGIDASIWTARASCSSGREDPKTSIVLFGNSQQAAGPLRIGQAALSDLLDIAALRRALTAAGLTVGEGSLTPEVRRRIVAVYVKVGTPPDGRLRGRRQVQEDRNPYYLAELKAAVAGMFAAELQDTVMYISGSAMHQGPPHGGNVAVVVDHSR